MPAGGTESEVGACIASDTGTFCRYHYHLGGTWRYGCVAKGRRALPVVLQECKDDSHPRGMYLRNHTPSTPITSLSGGHPDFTLRRPEDLASVGCRERSLKEILCDRNVTWIPRDCDKGSALSRQGMSRWLKEQRDRWGCECT
ncbi:hypothetical protein J6590_027656 [Homalodisca vitripennis]|nr:hypothetical protein J6590_027656 [Homalodisca vitripennis]